MSFVSPPLPPPPSETRFYCFAVTCPKPRSSGETGYESPRQNKDSWGCGSGFALRAHWKCTIFCFRLTHWLDQSQCNISICQLLQNDQECYWTLVKTKIEQGHITKTLLGLYPKDHQAFMFFFLRCARGLKGKLNLKFHSPEILYGYYFLAHYISNILTVS